MAAFVTAFMNPFNYVGGVSFTPEKDIPDLSEKVILVTGGRQTLNSTLTRSYQLMHDRKCGSGQRIHSPTDQAQPEENFPRCTFGIKSTGSHQVVEIFRFK
jgi:hypothetical protein